MARAGSVQGAKVWHSLKDLGSGEQDHSQLSLCGPAPASCPFPAGAWTRHRSSRSAAGTALALPSPGLLLSVPLPQAHWVPSSGRCCRTPPVGNGPPPGTRAARGAQPSWCCCPTGRGQPHTLLLVLGPAAGGSPSTLQAPCSPAAPRQLQEARGAQGELAGLKGRGRRQSPWGQQQCSALLLHSEPHLLNEVFWRKPHKVRCHGHKSLAIKYLLM